MSGNNPYHELYPEGMSRSLASSLQTLEPISRESATRSTEHAPLASADTAANEVLDRIEQELRAEQAKSPSYCATNYDCRIYENAMRRALEIVTTNRRDMTSK